MPLENQIQIRSKHKMKLSKTVFLFLLIETLVVFAICIGCGFVFFENPDWNLINPFLYKFQNGLLLFFKLLPAIFLSGIIIGYSWGFGKQNNNPTRRFSEIFILYLKNVVVTSLICTAICFVAIEVCVPLISYSRTQMEENSKNIDEYIILAKKNLATGDYGSALFYANYVLNISPNSQEAIDLARFIEESQYLQKKEVVPEEDILPTLVTTKTSGMTVPEILQKATDCYSKKDYFNAHYYSSLVLEISKQNYTNRDYAKQLASDSWNKLLHIDAFEDDLSKEVFQRKKDGYIALSSGDYSKAYYIYQDLLEKYPLDYDIKNFYEASKELLGTRYFFIDETLDKQQFEKFRNVFFTIPRLDGGKDLISIKGITSIETTGGRVQYLRGFSVVSYDKDEEWIMSLSVPYAKMCSMPLESMSQELSDYIGTMSNTKFVPYVFLKSVDRKYENIFITPRIETKEGLNLINSTSYVMPIPFENFAMLCEVSHGAETMSLGSLYRFSKVASEYGYSSEIFSQALVNRFTYPVVLLICFLLASIIAWNSRIFSEDSFKFSWLLLFPIIIFLAYAFIQCFRFIMSLIFYAILVFVAFVGNGATFVSLFILLFILLLCFIRFVSLKSDGVKE